MSSQLIRLLGFAALAASVAGCSDSKSSPNFVPVTADGGADAGAPDGGGADASPDGAATGPTGLAVLVGDYSSAAVTLLDPSTLGVLKDGCITSASFSSSQVALSGDVALASSPSPTHELVVIDRKNSILNFVAAPACTVRAQLSVSTGGFKANPQDVLVISEKKAYVTRYETNLALDPAQNGLDGGDDILIIDPSVPAVTGRIPLATYATAGTGPTQARPGQLLRTAKHVLVTLESLDGKFSDQGPGRVLAIDPETDKVTGMLDIPMFKNCGGLTEDPASQRVVVSCGGSFSALNQADESGLAIFDLGGEPSAMTIIKASALGTQPLSFASVSMAGVNTAFVAALGSSDFKTGAVIANDLFVRVDLAAGTGTKVLMSSPYGFGGHLVVKDKVVLADGDATTPRLRVLPTDGSAEGTPFDPNPSRHLPPRDVVWY